MRYTVLLFIMAHFSVSLVVVPMCSVFWLFWLSYQYLPSECVYTAYDFLGLLYFFIVLLCTCVVACPYLI